MEKDEILRIFRNYVSGIIRFNDLEDWVLSHLQAVLDSGNQEAIALMDKVDALLIEVNAGVATEQELFATISGIVNEAVRLELTINDAPDVVLEMVEESIQDSTTAELGVFDLSPRYV